MRGPPRSVASFSRYCTPDYDFVTLKNLSADIAIGDARWCVRVCVCVGVCVCVWNRVCVSNHCNGVTTMSNHMLGDG